MYLVKGSYLGSAISRVKPRTARVHGDTGMQTKLRRAWWPWLNVSHGTEHGTPAAQGLERGWCPGSGCTGYINNPKARDQVYGWFGFLDFGPPAHRANASFFQAMFVLWAPPLSQGLSDSTLIWIHLSPPMGLMLSKADFLQTSIGRIRLKHSKTCGTSVKAALDSIFILQSVTLRAGTVWWLVQQPGLPVCFRDAAWTDILLLIYWRLVCHLGG